PGGIGALPVASGCSGGAGGTGGPGGGGGGGAGGLSVALAYRGTAPTEVNTTKTVSPQVATGGPGGANGNGVDPQSADAGTPEGGAADGGADGSADGGASLVVYGTAGIDGLSQAKLEL